MKRKKRALVFGISLVFIIAIIHLSFHFTFFGTGISGFYEHGISGFSIGKISIGEELKQEYSNLSPISFLILAFEWIFFIILVVITIINSKKEIKKEIEEIGPLEKYKKSNKDTDIDIFYNIIKEKKVVGLNSITKVFGVDEETILNWINTLEKKDLINIYYPRFSQPEIHVKE